MGFFIFLAIVAVVVLLIIRRSKKRKAENVIVYAEYYAQKRKEFPWLDNWIKENGDPEQSRAKEFMAEKDPGELEPEAGLTLECPSCGCPHSWVMLQKDSIVDKVEKEVQETTTTIKGGGQDWGFGASDVTHTKSKTLGYIYHGRAIKDFKCFNCGHTEQNEYNEQWKSKDGNWGTGSHIKTYHPPITAYDYWNHDITEEWTRQQETKKANETYEQAKEEEERTAATQSIQQTQVSKNNLGISELLLKAAELGSMDAQYDIATKYLFGQGVAADEEQGAMWLEKAWYQDYSDVEFDFLPSLFQRGYSLYLDEKFDEAFLYLKKVSEMGHSPAYTNLGDCCRDGHGVSVDIEKARYWYKKAIDEIGDDDAKKALKKLK